MANASGHISTAPPGPPLSDLGQEQSRELARRTAALRIDAVFSSPMLRAVQTAAEIAAVHAVTSTASEDLLELYAGEVEGMPADEGMRILGKGWQRWIDHARYEESVAPGGESAVVAVARLQSFVKSARQLHPGNRRVAVVSHAGLLHLVCALCVNMPFDHGYRNWLRNTESAEVADTPDGLQCVVWGGLPVDPDLVTKVRVEAPRATATS
jgi:probable phosphoglycerate mutase